jgi:hypothetical protein
MGSPQSLKRDPHPTVYVDSCEGLTIFYENCEIVEIISPSLRFRLKDMVVTTVSKNSPMEPGLIGSIVGFTSPWVKEGIETNIVRVRFFGPANRLIVSMKVNQIACLWE